MVRLYARFAHPSYSDEQIIASISSILENNTTLAMATIKNGVSYINTVFYAYNSSLDLFIFTEPRTQHSQNIDINPSVALMIWTRPKHWGDHLQGLQIFGICERVQKLRLVDTTSLYTQRFPVFGQLIKHPMDFAKGVTDARFYVIRASKLLLLDEAVFGRRDYISLTIAT